MKGGKCHFPFKADDEEHLKCITTDEHKHGAWCSLTPDYDVDQKWGYCQPGPPTTGGTGRDGIGGETTSTFILSVGTPNHRRHGQGPQGR